jgi:magnesium-transporting ATPase (P-type)
MCCAAFTGRGALVRFFFVSSLLILWSYDKGHPEIGYLSGTHKRRRIELLMASQQKRFRTGEEDICFDVKSKAHTTSAEDVLRQLQVDPHWGLSAEEHHRRLERYGPNIIPEGAKTPAIERLWEQINSFVIYLLIVGAAVSFGFHHLLDGFVIVGVVVINVILGFCMESKAVNATEALKRMMSSHTKVLRNGTKTAEMGSSLTLGDIFFLQPGDIVPADGRVIKASKLSVLEAILTGESQAVMKNVDANPHLDASVADRKCIVYSGTQVLQGTATVVTTAVGAHCEIGKISGMLAAVKPEKTPLLLQLDRFGQILSVIVIVIAVTTFGAAYARGYSVADALGIAIGVSVAFIPEGLPACITVTFAVGVIHMAARNAVVKTLPAVETLGSVSVICSDKTGTLTQNRMTVKGIRTQDASFEVG